MRLSPHPVISCDIRQQPGRLSLEPSALHFKAHLSSRLLLSLFLINKKERKKESRATTLPSWPRTSTAKSYHTIMTNVDPARPSLTSNDTAVLQALFDAESSPSSGITVDPSLPPWPATVNISQTDLASLKSRETEIVRKLQTSSTPSRENVQSALNDLDSLLTQYPTYPSAYTNRAQALRLLVHIEYNERDSQDNPYALETTADDALFAPEAYSLTSRIFADLGQAVSLATPASPADPLSSVQARLLADTHTHRGYLLLKAARVKKQRARSGSGEAVGPECIRELSVDRLEEMASHDFFLGGRYGNKAAQQLAVQTNPYAKMCGAIVKEAMRKEVEG